MSIKLPLGVICLVVALLLGARLYHSQSFAAPPNDWDGVYYEALAMGLLDGRGFAPRLDQEFVSAYEGVPFITSGAYAERLALDGVDSTTTFRPPLFPVVIAVSYAAFGRSFIAVQLLQIIFIAIAVWFLGRALLRLNRPTASLLVALPFLLDPSMNALISGPLTEPLMMVWMSVFLYLGLVAFQDRSMPHAAGAGFALGLATLTRSAVAPLIFLIPFSLCIWALHQGGARDCLRRVAAPMIVCGLLTLLPWGVRNCLVTKSFMPLGSHSGIFLGQLYQDSILEAGGYWTFENTWDPATSVPPDLTGVEREIALSKEGFARATTWIQEHRSEIPRLLWERIREFWWPERRPDQKALSLILLCASVLLLVTRERNLLALFCTVTVAYSLIIIVTTNDYAGRYFYTVFPLAAVGFALLLDSLGARLLRAFPNRRRVS